MTQRLPWECRKSHADMVDTLLRMACSLDAKNEAGVMDTDEWEAEDFDECWPNLSKLKTAPWLRYVRK